MAITDANIRREPLGRELREILVKINDATATNNDVSAALISLPEKAICRSLIAASATRQQISASLTPLPFKEVAYAIAGV